jgi:hypothetical protein
MLHAALALFLAQDANEIMHRMADAVEKASAGRRHYVYQQSVRGRLLRTNGQLAREEKRQYVVVPDETGTKKDLTVVEGQYQKGKQLIPYHEAGFKYKDTDIDGDLLDDLLDDLVDAKKSRDGIPHSLFPLRRDDLPHYKFTHVRTFDFKGRSAHEIAFEPATKKKCLEIGDDDDDKSDCRPWKGSLYVDALEHQPVFIQTKLAWEMPRLIRYGLGTNLQQTGFAIRYERLAEHVWFPVSYGTEFKFSVLFGYKRVVTMALESHGFKRTDVNSTIAFQ